MRQVRKNLGDFLRKGKGLTTSWFRYGDTTALIANHRGSSGLIARFQSNNGNVYAIQKNGNASLVGTHFASDHVNTSDARLKEDITPVGLVMTGDGKTAYVGLGAANHVAGSAG